MVKLKGSVNGPLLVVEHGA